MAVEVAQFTFEPMQSAVLPTMDCRHRTHTYIDISSAKAVGYKRGIELFFRTRAGQRKKKHPDIPAKAPNENTHGPRNSCRATPSNNEKCTDPR